MADKKIDVHAHFMTKSYHETLLENGIAHPDGTSDLPIWCADEHIAYMNSAGIAKSILSISSPGTNPTPNIALNRTITRETNEYAAELKRQHKDRFGFFASLPISDIPASVSEIGYALDTLDADGFVLMSNTNHIYLGDPILRPVLSELNTRNAVVFIHPTSACLHHKHKTYDESYIASSPLSTVYPAPYFEFFFDSARTILDLLNSGTVVRYPQIRWIVSHCGGVLPSLLDRMFMMLRFAHSLAPAEQPISMTEEQVKDLTMRNHPIPKNEDQIEAHANARDPVPVTEQEVRDAFRERFWFDLAGNPVPNQVESLLKFTTVGALLFGSDVPWTPYMAAEILVAEAVRDLPGVVGEENVDAVLRGNAEDLFGKLVEE